ncbi:MAG: TonB-dependent receptor, partial [Fulvivirga sp.]|nr:TonB-dependent receptor [Fulvivirga sp.]
ILGDDGFLPDFQTLIKDNTITVGLRGQKGQWFLDLSSTFGVNKMDYTIGNTVNSSLGLSSPTSFRAGGYEFIQTVHNFDASRQFKWLNVAIGAEFRSENFIAHAGEEGSFEGRGAESFPGIRPQDEVDAQRFNVSFYTELEKSFEEKLLINLAGRYEDYTDFGRKLNGKLSARYKIIEELLNLRGSISTGFRAPSLHQTHFSSVQTILVGSELSQQGTFNNESPVIKALGVPDLKEETSENFSLGLTLTPTSNIFITTDFYKVNVNDRIVFTGTLRNDDPNTVVGGILESFDIEGMKFFTNAIDTETLGFDFVMGYDNIDLGLGRAKVTLAHNYNKTNVTSEIRTPDILSNQGNALFNRKEQSRVETARPLNKTILKLSYQVRDWSIDLNNTRFGQVTWKHADNGLNDILNMTDPEFDQTFSGKIITDLDVSYHLSAAINLSVGANNLFDVYPDEIDPKGDLITNLIGRFRYPWEVNQFGFRGRFYYFKLKVNLL